MGMKTQQVVRVDERSALTISSVPRTEATLGLTPLCLYEYMFSITTMELSTSIPMPSARPARVMRFRERPA